MPYENNSRLKQDTRTKLLKVTKISKVTTTNLKDNTKNWLGDKTRVPLMVNNVTREKSNPILESLEMSKQGNTQLERKAEKDHHNMSELSRDQEHQPPTMKLLVLSNN